MKWLSYFLLSTKQHCYVEACTLSLSLCVCSTTHISVCVCVYVEEFLTYPHKFLQKLVWTVHTNSAKHLQRFISCRSVFPIVFAFSSFGFVRSFVLFFSSSLISRGIIKYRIYHINKITLTLEILHKKNIIREEAY